MLYPNRRHIWVRNPWTAELVRDFLIRSGSKVGFGSRPGNPGSPDLHRTNLELIFVRESIIAFRAHVVKFPRGIEPGISREIPDLLKGVSTVFTRVHGGILPC